MHTAHRTDASTSPWCMCLQFPSARGSSDARSTGTRCSRRARTEREHTTHSSRRAALRSSQRCSSGRSRWWCLEVLKNIKQSIQSGENFKHLQVVQSPKQSHSPFVQSLDMMLGSFQEDRKEKSSRTLCCSAKKSINWLTLGEAHEFGRRRAQAYACAVRVPHVAKTFWNYIDRAKGAFRNGEHLKTKLHILNIKKDQFVDGCIYSLVMLSPPGAFNSWKRKSNIKKSQKTPQQNS